jgi:hypothetical protein
VDCSKERGLLSEYIDGRLAPSEALRLEEHLRACPECAAEEQSLRQTVAWLQELPVVEAPRSFAIPTYIGAPLAVPWWRRWPSFQGLRVATAACATMLVLALALQLVMSTSTNLMPSYSAAKQGRLAEAPAAVDNSVAPSEVAKSSLDAAPLKTAPILATAGPALAAPAAPPAAAPSAATTGPALAPAGPAAALAATPAPAPARPAAADRAPATVGPSPVSGGEPAPTTRGPLAGAVDRSAPKPQEAAATPVVAAAAAPQPTAAPPSVRQEMPETRRETAANPLWLAIGALALATLILGAATMVAWAKRR